MALIAVAFGFTMSGTVYAQNDDEVLETIIVTGVPNPLADTANFKFSIGVDYENGLGIQVWGRNVFDHESFISTLG